MTTDTTNAAQPQPPDSAERERRRRITETTRAWLSMLGTLVRQLRVHAVTNALVQQQLQRTWETISALRDAPEAPVAFVFADAHTFVGGVWVRADRHLWEHAQAITQALSQLGARGFVLDPSPILSADGLLRFALALRDAPDQGPAQPPDPAALPGVRLIPRDDPDTDQQVGNRAASRAQAYNILREGVMVLDANAVQRLDLFMRRRQRALVQQLIELAERSTEDLLAMTTLRDPELASDTHSLMVSIFAIGVGRLLGLNRRDLSRLGVAALNHNLGEAFLPGELFAQPRELSGAEKAQVQTHPLLGFHHVLHHYGFDGVLLDRAIVCAEHHVHWNGAGGYPFATRAPIHGFSRIIAICDAFNALISPRPHRAPYPPDQALKLILRRAGERFDPTLVRAFTSLVGRHPPGSVVELDTGEWAIVLGPGQGETPLRRPRVLVVTDEDGFELPKCFAVDLGERHARRRAWLRTLVRNQDPGGLDLKISAYLLADRAELPPQRLDRDEFAERRARRAQRKARGNTQEHTLILEDDDDV